MGVRTWLVTWLNSEKPIKKVHMEMKVFAILWVYIKKFRYVCKINAKIIFIFQVNYTYLTLSFLAYIHLIILHLRWSFFLYNYISIKIFFWQMNFFLLNLPSSKWTDRGSFIYNSKYKCFRLQDLVVYTRTIMYLHVNLAEKIYINSLHRL